MYLGNNVEINVEFNGYSKMTHVSLIDHEIKEYRKCIFLSGSVPATHVTPARNQPSLQGAPFNINKSVFISLAISILK